MKKLIISTLTLFTLVSCSSSPVLYPNAKYESVGKEVAKADIKTCTDKAEKFLASSKGKQILKGAGGGAAVGTAVGAVTGLFTGDFLRGLTQGAATGAAAGGTVGAISPDQLKRRYIEHCLGRAGYQVIGWD